MKNDMNINFIYMFLIILIMKIYKKKVEIKKGYKANCVICGKEFISENEHKFYCSDTCHNIFKQKEDFEKKDLTKSFKNKEIEIKTKVIDINNEYHRSKNYKKNLKNYYIKNKNYIKELRKIQYLLKNNKISKEEYQNQLKKLKLKYNKN